MTEATAAALKHSDPIPKEELDTFGKDMEAAAIPGANESDAAKGWFAFLYKRSTYYWIALIAHFAQLILQTIGLTVAGIHRDKETGFSAVWFFYTGIYSSLAFIINLALLVLHRRKRQGKGLKRITAGKLYNSIRTCAFFNILTLLLLVISLMDSDYVNLAKIDPIRPVIVPLLFGFAFVAALANIAAAYITYNAAKQARGTDLVVDPDYRVPAWTLSTPEESQGLLRQNAVQLPS